MTSHDISTEIKILIVDDSIKIANRLNKLIESNIDAPVSVQFADNVAQAFTLVNTTLPDVVILDIQFDKINPKLNGIYFLQQLKEKYPLLPVIMFTNYADPLYRKKCKELGADYFFDKSHEFEKVPGVINRLIAKIQTKH